MSLKSLWDKGTDMLANLLDDGSLPVLRDDGSLPVLRDNTNSLPALGQVDGSAAVDREVDKYIQDQVYQRCNQVITFGTMFGMACLGTALWWSKQAKEE